MNINCTYECTCECECACEMTLRDDHDSQMRDTMLLAYCFHPKWGAFEPVDVGKIRSWTLGRSALSM